MDGTCKGGDTVRKARSPGVSSPNRPLSTPYQALTREGPRPQTPPIATNKTSLEASFEVLF